MTEEVTRIFPSEIGSVRLTCRDCGLTTEAKIESLYKLFKNGVCPHCNVRVTDQEDILAFTEFSKALQKLNSTQDAFQTQLVLVVLPEKPNPTR